MNEPVPLDICTSLKDSYLTYSMSVIVSRALPDARDGLKPSQRRILMAMHDLGLSPGSSTSKCAGIVGETMKRYHPHGDNSIYPTLTRMAQWWNTRVLLVTGQGNFGSIHGLPPAAMRYTEAKLGAVAAEMLDDIKLDTVDFQPSYDEKHQEPVVLPGKFPNLLVNGSNGIAVGMSTSIPPHNLSEICSAVNAYLDDPKITIDSLMSIVRGPDFPTGGTICGLRGIRDSYRKGRGRLVVRSAYTFEKTKEGRTTIVFTEIPYQITKEYMLKKIGEAVQSDKIEGISDVVDESDRKNPVRIVCKVKKGQDENIVLNQLFEFTPLQDTFSVIMLALVDGRPKTLNLKDLIKVFVDHRISVIRRRTQYLLRQAKQKAHLLEGLLIALSSIDQIIKEIRNSQSPSEARSRLMGLEMSTDVLQKARGEKEDGRKTTLTKMQADAILVMQLQRLTALEFNKIASDYVTVVQDIKYYEKILSSESEIIDLIRMDMRDLKNKYGTPRRTKIGEEEAVDFDADLLIPEEQMVVTITNNGYIKRLQPDTYRVQNRGGRGITATSTKSEDFLKKVFTASTHDYILFFTNLGRIYWLKVYDIPMATRTAAGRAIVNLLDLGAREKITSMIPVSKFTEDQSLFMVTKNGVVKKTELTAFRRPLGKGIIAIGLDDGDLLVDVALTKDEDDVILASRKGMAIRFRSSTVRNMGRPAGGVNGMKLEENDEIVGVVVVNRTNDPGSLLTVCSKGIGKRTLLEEYRSQSRAGKGVIDVRLTSRNGEVVAIAKVNEQDEIMLTTQGGNLIRMAVRRINPTGRNTQGMWLVRLDEDDTVSSMTTVAPEPDEEEERKPIAL